MEKNDPYSPHANWIKPQFKRKQENMPTGDLPDKNTKPVPYVPNEDVKWFKQSNRPPYYEVYFSISVLLYSPSLDVYSIGWFDFENEEWSHIADEEMEDFIWTYLPKTKI